MAEPHFFGDADVTPLAAAALAVWLLIFLWRSWKLLRPASACSDGLEYALALRSAAVYVLGICSVPLLFPCRSAPEEPVSSWATCSKSPYSFIPTNLMRIFHILPFWYAFLVTPYLGGLVKSICDAILGVSLGLVAVSFLNLMLPGGAAGPEYLTSDYFERAWLPFRYSTPAAFSLALCLTYGLFVSNLSVAKKQYAMCIYSELLVPFMSPHTRTGFRAAEADMFRSGRRKGWHKPPQPEVPQLPETPAERRLAQGVGDLLGRLRRGGAAQSEDASAKPSQTGDGVAEIQEPPCKQQKTEHKAASFSKPSTVELGPEPLEEDEDASDPEWNLNSPDDCCSFIEHYFPAKEAEALGVSIDMFSKVAKFYVNFLRTKRTPKADLCVHFAKEIIEPKTLNSKAGRKNWLQTWLTERKRVFVPKT